MKMHRILRIISKLIEQLVQENNELENEVRSIKFQDIPLIKKFMMQRSIISEKPNLTSAPTGASTISHFQSLNKSKADNELNESGIGVSYFQRYARVNDSNLNIRVNNN